MQVRHGTKADFALIQAIVAVTTCLVFVGCRQAGDEGNRVPVLGRVTFKDGKPLPRGTVIFSPDGGKGNGSLQEPRGLIDANGNYKLMTTPKFQGASPGWYVVTIIAQEPYDESKSSWDPPWLINRKYGNRQTSGLAVEVIDKAEAGRYDLQVTK